MNGATWTEIIMAVITVIILPLIPKLMKMLSAIANKNNLLSKTLIDDKLFLVLGDIIKEVTMPVAEKYKEFNDGGKLTPFQIEELKKMALDKLKTVGKEKGIDFLKECGPELVSLVVEKIVRMVKDSKN